MAQKRYILAHQDGQFLAINEGSHWIYVPDAGLATSFTQTKATNILQNMIKPKEREHWQLMPYAQPSAGQEQPPVDKLPEEEVPEPAAEKEAIPEKPAAEPAPKAKRGRKKAAPAEPAPEEPKETAPQVSESKEKESAPAQPENKPAKSESRQKAKKKVVPAKAPHPVPAQAEEPYALVNEWMDKAAELKRQYETLLQRKKDLTEELRQVSAELCDLEHYIEFTSLNAAKGYRIYRRLRDCLIRRRKIKDELMCISIFLKAEPHNILNGNLYRQFNGLRTREYAPRVLGELFQEWSRETGRKPGQLGPKKDEDQPQSKE